MLSSSPQSDPEQSDEPVLPEGEDSEPEELPSSLVEPSAEPLALPLALPLASPPALMAS